MKVIYLDASLAGEIGHFAGVCRNVTAALRGLGLQTVVFSYHGIEPPLKNDLSALPLFRLAANSFRKINDPICGWLVSYSETVQVTIEDLGRVRGISADDVIVYNCARPAQIAAMVQWLQQQFAAGQCPQVLIILGWPSGVTWDPDMPGPPKGWRLSDQTSCLYRLAATAIAPAYSSRIRFGIGDAAAAEAYEALLARPVEVLPGMQQATTPPRDRSSVTQPCVAFLGEQRLDKGYQLVPEIVAELLAANIPLRILVQNSWQRMDEQNAALQTIAARDPRLTVRIGTLPPSGWSQQLSEADLIVLPYDSSTYETSLSGIGAEAVANGIPQAVPAGTGLSRLLTDYGMPGVSFPQSEPAAVVKAVLDAIEEWPAVTARASQARELWAERNSLQQLAAAILGKKS